MAYLKDDELNFNDNLSVLYNDIRSDHVVHYAELYEAAELIKMFITVISINETAINASLSE